MSDRTVRLHDAPSSPSPGALPRWLTLAAMLAVLAWAGSVFVGLDGHAAPGRYAIDLPWMPALGVSLRFAVDGLNVYLLLLTALIFPVVLACTWSGPEARSTLWLVLVLVLEAALLGTFLAQNLVLFFVLWEAVLIPMLLLIAVFGGEQRRRAALTFFLYTMAGSVLFLAAVIVLGAQSLQQTGHWAFDFDTLATLRLSRDTQLFVFWAIVLACAVKSPLFPFHSWLPLAYGEASPAGTALMAGVMSKMGAYGLIKLALPLCPDVAPALAPLMVGWAVLSILYGAVLALRQADAKLLLAYASLSHMGYIVLGVFSAQSTGLHGALFQMLSHGLVVAGLFLVLGMVTQRSGEAEGGVPATSLASALASRAPRLAVVLMLFVLASLALPLSSGFTAEFLVLLGAFTQGLATWRADGGAGLLVAAVLACGGVVLGATYMLRWARTLVFGDAGSAPPLRDLGLREGLALAPLLLLIVGVGVAPRAFMAKVEPAVAALSARAALAARPAPAAAAALSPPAALAAPSARPAVVAAGALAVPGALRSAGIAAKAGHAN